METKTEKNYYEAVRNAIRLIHKNLENMGVTLYSIDRYIEQYEDMRAYFVWCTQYAIVCGLVSDMMYIRDKNSTVVEEIVSHAFKEVGID